jgi:hypothetical protein
MLVPASYWSHGYVRKTQWQQEWMMAAKLERAPIIDVRQATSKKGSHSPLDASVSASIEAAKYAAKSTDIEKLGALAPELHHQVRGLRFYGVSRALAQYVGDSEPLGEELCDADAIAASDVPGLHLIAEWDQSAGRYQFRI